MVLYKYMNSRFNKIEIQSSRFYKYNKHWQRLTCVTQVWTQNETKYDKRNNGLKYFEWFFRTLYLYFISSVIKFTVQVSFVIGYICTRPPILNIYICTQICPVSCQFLLPRHFLYFVSGNMKLKFDSRRIRHFLF